MSRKMLKEKVRKNSLISLFIQIKTKSYFWGQTHPDTLANKHICCNDSLKCDEM